MFTIANKGYLQPEFQEKYDAFITALRDLFDIIPPNAPGSHMFAADDMICWFRTLGFLDDPSFIKATDGFEGSRVMRGKLWRVYNVCWAAKHSYPLSPFACDLGTYDGKTIQIADRYTDHGFNWYLYDAFDHHPTEKIKQKHSGNLIEEVQRRIPNARIVAGLLPDSLIDMEPLSFLHVDLNNAEAELACLEMLYDRVVPGGSILLDDYGWKRYEASHRSQRNFFKSHGQEVLEMATGDGLVIKRG